MRSDDERGRIRYIWGYDLETHDIIVNYETFIYSFIYFTIVYAVDSYERYKHKHWSVPNYVLIVHAIYN